MVLLRVSLRAFTVHIMLHIFAFLTYTIFLLLVSQVLVSIVPIRLTGIRSPVRANYDVAHPLPSVTHLSTSAVHPSLLRPAGKCWHLLLSPNESTLLFQLAIYASSRVTRPRRSHAVLWTRIQRSSCHLRWNTWPIPQRHRHVPLPSLPHQAPNKLHLLFYLFHDYSGSFSQHQFSRIQGVLQWNH